MQNESPFSLAFEQAEDEPGRKIGYPALVYHQTTKRPERYTFEPSRDGGSDIMDEDRPIRDTDLVARLNEQDDDIQHYKAIVKESRAELRAERDRTAAINALHAVAIAERDGLLAANTDLRTMVNHQQRLLTGCRAIIRDAAIPVSVAFLFEFDRVIDTFNALWEAHS